MIQTAVMLYREYGVFAVLKYLVTRGHIGLIRFVAFYRPVIIGVDFDGGIKLKKDGRAVLIAHCEFTSEAGKVRGGNLEISIQ